MSGLLATVDSRTRSRPFPLLVRLFVARVFRGSGTSEDGELDLSIGLILALLALPGAFYSLFLLEKYSTLLQWMHGQKELDPLAGALPDEYFFIVLSMVVTGVVAVWRWDSIFPDRRDYANLVPLPISLRSIFLANLAAILLLALLLAVDVNAASAVLFPLVVSASENTFSFFLHFVGVHAFVVVLASVFSFCTVFAIVGAAHDRGAIWLIPQDFVLPARLSSRMSCSNAFHELYGSGDAAVVAAHLCAISATSVVPWTVPITPWKSNRIVCQPGTSRSLLSAHRCDLRILNLCAQLSPALRAHPRDCGCISGGRSQERYLAFSSRRSELLEESVPTGCLSLCDQDIAAERTAWACARCFCRVRYRSRMPVPVYVFKRRQS